MNKTAQATTHAALVAAIVGLVLVAGLIAPAGATLIEIPLNQPVDFFNTDVVIPPFFTLGLPTFEFNFQGELCSNGHCVDGRSWVNVNSVSQVVVGPAPNRDAVGLGPGVTIPSFGQEFFPPATPFQFNTSDLARTFTDLNGHVTVGGDFFTGIHFLGFFGLLDSIGTPQFAYGWFEIQGHGDGTVTLLELAFNPGSDPVMTPTPEPSTLGLFALSSGAMIVLRRKLVRSARRLG